MFVLTNERHHS